MTIDPTIFNLITWALTFLFGSLIAILVWLGKSVMGKIDIIVKNQESDAIDRTGIKKDIDSIKTDVHSLKLEMKDVPELKLKLIKLETNEGHLLEDVSHCKKHNVEMQKKMNELSERMSKYDQIINDYIKK